jgi:hypothetical protein
MTQFFEKMKAQNYALAPGAVCHLIRNRVMFLVSSFVIEFIEKLLDNEWAKD